MTSGPVMIQVLEGENAIAKNRELMGATDPKKAAPGTIRADFAKSIDANAVHGSDGARDRARRRSPTSSPRWRSTAAERRRPSCRRRRAVHDDQPARPRRRGPRAPSSPSAARSRFARSRCRAGCTSGFVDDVGAMTDLARRAARARWREVAEIRGPTVIRDTTAADGTRKWLLDVGQRQRRRGGLHPRGRPRHAVHLVAGGLRARLRVLLDRQAGLQPQPHHRRDRRPAVARQSRAARRRRQRAMGRARPRADHQRRDDGHGRAARQLRQRRRRRCG